FSCVQAAPLWHSVVHDTLLNGSLVTGIPYPRLRDWNRPVALAVRRGGPAPDSRETRRAGGAGAMKIVVLVKQVPDTAADKRLDPDTLTVDRAAVDGLINEMDEFAIEEALQLVEKHGGEVTVVSMGPEDATEAYKKALQMGPTRPSSSPT